MLLDQDIPESYNVYYNGWDRRNTAPQSGVSIHHPSGDYKKISTYTNKGEHATWYGTDSVIGERSAHWNVVFTETENGHGVTEGGSSGSPLFNQNHLVVGTLSGGSSSCEEPDELNLYGKLAYHWNKYSLADTARMDIWLDPEGTGAETLNGLSHTATKPAPTDLKLSYENKDVNLNWTSPDYTETPMYYTIYRTNQVIGTTENTSFTDTDVNLIGEVFYSVTAEYSDESESLPLNGSIIIQEYKAPENLMMNKNGNEVTLSWDKPLYTQAISWSTSDSSFTISANIPVYFGQAWDADDLLNIDNNLITAIECYIAKDATYEVYIVQGERTYKQSVSKSDYSEKKTIELTTPFVIDASNDLIISLYTSSTNNDTGTMACDAGPAVIGKGNLISEDGQEWFVLYDGTEESEELSFDSDCNFYLAAIISSEKGTVSTLKSFSSKNFSKQYSGQLQKTRQTASLRATTESTLFQYPAAFPEITGYKVYRNSELLTTDPINAIEYTDKTSPAGIHTYGVSTVYGTEESDKILSEISVANEQIINGTITLTPTLFTDQIRIGNAGSVDKLEIYAINGLRVQQIRNPGETINTSSLIPGVYIFKLYTEKGILTFEGIKK
ncbi:MAG: T9SS type A sorting domain-containing protein [Massilibacteroides sp.]|nr:T9SS type A sorting domain-containing protein [Massilibacteroides sp.]